MKNLAELLFVGALTLCLLLELIGTPIVKAVKKARKDDGTTVD